MIGRHTTPCILLLTLLLTICGSVTAETHIGGEISGILDREGSPYVVDENLVILAEDTLIIEAGVDILFRGARAIFCHGSIIANGTEEDSILFDGYVDDRYWSWNYIAIGCDDSSEVIPSSIFSYCTFRRASCMDLQDNMDVGALHLYGVNIVIEYCTFDDLSMPIKSWDMGNELSFTVRGCYFNDGYCIFAYANSVVEDCIFGPCGLASENIGLNVSNCTFQGPFCGIDAFDPFTVNNSVFIDCFIYFCNYHNEELPNIRYNIFYPILDYYYESAGGEIEDLGIPDRINANGDSTDRFGNLIMDPLLVDSDDFPEAYFLTEDSPCIDAGDPDSDLDPDGTRADIGAFHFHQRDIDVIPNTVLFETPGTIDSAAVTIRNIGLTSLTLTSQTITPDNSPFSIDDDVGEVEVEPQSEHTTWVHFTPDEAGIYEAVLVIESDDPDEEIVEVPLNGNALNVEMDRNLPLSFGITGAYPNPFNSTTTIHYELPTPTDITIKLYDIHGRELITLDQGQHPAGHHRIVLNGEHLAAGIYLCKLETGSQYAVRKAVIVK